MDTKKQTNPAGKKGGRNPFGNIALAAGSLIVGAATAEAIEKWRKDHQDSTEEAQLETETHTEEVPEQEEQVEEQNTQQEQASEPQQEVDEPQPVDPETPSPSEPEPEEQNSTAESTVDEVAQNIAQSEEIDPIDAGFTAYMNVGEHRTVYTEDGEVDAFEVEFNDPALAGYPFLLTDSNGDGFYDSVCMADGTPANIMVNAPDHPTMDSILAQVGLTQSDLEEMHQSGGGYLSPDEGNDMAQNDDPSGDMIDENGNQVAQEQVAQAQQPAAEDDDDVDDEVIAALLAGLLVDDDDEEEVTGAEVEYTGDDAQDDELSDEEIAALLAALDDDEEDDDPNEAGYSGEQIDVFAEDDDSGDESFDDSFSDDPYDEV